MFVMCQSLNESFNFYCRLHSHKSSLAQAHRAFVVTLFVSWLFTHRNFTSWRVKGKCVLEHIIEAIRCTSRNTIEPRRCKESKEQWGTFGEWKIISAPSKCCLPCFRRLRMTKSKFVAQRNKNGVDAWQKFLLRRKFVELALVWRLANRDFVMINQLLGQQKKSLIVHTICSDTSLN